MTIKTNSTAACIAGVTVWNKANIRVKTCGLVQTCLVIVQINLIYILFFAVNRFKKHVCEHKGTSITKVNRKPMTLNNEQVCRPALWTLWRGWVKTEMHLLNIVVEPELQHCHSYVPDWTRSWASSIHSPPHNLPISILILSSHLLNLPTGHSIKSYIIQSLYTFLISLIRATYLRHRNFFDFTSVTIPGNLYKSRSSSVCSILNFPMTSSILDQTVFLST